jgi:hypothetical protein
LGQKKTAWQKRRWHVRASKGNLMNPAYTCSVSTVLVSTSTEVCKDSICTVLQLISP